MKIVFSVTNDISYDQRMHRICSTLADEGFEVLLVGRLRKNSKTLSERNYQCHRIPCKNEHGKSFYLEYNYKLWKFLQKCEADVFCAIDLDTILPHYLVTQKNKKPFGYDAHEYFSEMEEVVRRPLIKAIWKRIERKCVPKVTFAYTISRGYKELFESEYNQHFDIIRNVSLKREQPTEKRTSERPIVLYQGAVNEGRGLQELIKAMSAVEAKLVICGKGDVFEELISLADSHGVADKVAFRGYVAPEELAKITPTATIGITIFTNNGLSNQFSLANRFFDYFHAGVPQLAMQYPEYELFNAQHQVAHLIREVTPKAIADGLNKLLRDKAYYQKLVQACKEAAEEHNWQKESKKLIAIYKQVEKQINSVS